LFVYVYTTFEPSPEACQSGHVRYVNPLVVVLVVFLVVVVVVVVVVDVDVVGAGVRQRPVAVPNNFLPTRGHLLGFRDFLASGMRPRLLAG